ncbi:3-hydroxyacyl-ACP dehydratase FabZ [Isoptericola croceus]|uniref:3-hydroxyacyl-ACP dehydratase FabZ n=1 Tax=Isoptericola croceus TaxID=3031406 RepID=UPI0023F88B18|nr:3-hydroxyacyl-ACP dehydratase FabZ [Isoptericola croceus]
MTVSEAVAPTVRGPLTSDEIREILPHRWPFLLVDRVEKVEPGVRGTGIKNVTGTEAWFQGHFPGTAVLPGVVLIEAMAQMAGVVFALAGAGPIGYLASVRSMRFRRTVVPGDQVVLTVARTAGGRGFTEFKVDARVAGALAADGTLALADPAAQPPQKV